MTDLAPHKAQWNARQALEVPKLLADRLPPGSVVWDPCAGVGIAFHDTMGPAAGWVTFGSEIEPEWAGWRPAPADLLAPDGWPMFEALATAAGPCSLGTITADSTRLPDRLVGAFAGALTSYVFDNRMNDRFVGESDYLPGTRKCKACAGTGQVAGDTIETAGPNPIASTEILRCSVCDGTGKVARPPAVKTFPTPTGDVVRPDRMNYAAMLGRIPHPRSAAGLRGPAWRQLTMLLLRAQIAAVRIGGTIAVELKDAIEDNGTRTHSVEWFLGYVCSGQCPGVRLDRVHALTVPGDRRGQNHDARLSCSQLIVLTRTEGII